MKRGISVRWRIVGALGAMLTASLMFLAGGPRGASSNRSSAHG